MIDLSIILISKDQEWNIGRLIESVQREAANIKSKEIVLVDSASTDRTVDIAGNYPINILRLRPDQHLTPAAGRYMGYKNSTGNLILFLDGDMELFPGWLEKAFQALKTNSDIAVVTGELIDLSKSTGIDDKPHLIEESTDTMIELPHGGGAAIYRRSVLEQVGSFNPYLYSEEEPELCIRIRQARYRIVQIRHPIAYHYTDPKGKLSTLIGRWKRNLFFGFGQNLRYHFGDPIFWTYFKERGYCCLPGLVVVFGFVSLLISVFSGQKIWFWACVLLLLTITALREVCRKRSLYQSIASIIHRILILGGAIRGFFMKPLPPEGFAEKLDIVKQTDWHNSDKEFSDHV